MRTTLEPIADKAQTAVPVGKPVLAVPKGCKALPGLHIHSLPHTRLELGQHASAAMHLDSEGVVAVLGHAACISPLSLRDLKLPGLSIVDELNADTQVALSPVLGSHLRPLPV